MPKKSIWKNYGLLIAMLVAIIIGCIVGAVWPNVYDGDGNMVTKGASYLAPLGKIFINLMFCIVVPMVFASIAGAVANMRSRKRAGKIMGTTIVTFVITGAIAAVIMIVLMKIIPPVLSTWGNLAAGTVDEQKSAADLVVSFFTAEDFVGLLSRRAMLPLIIFSILFGFGVQMAGGPDTMTAKVLNDLSEVMMKIVGIITYYAPVAFFGFFADLVATYGPSIAGSYGRGLAVYYPLCFLYVLIAFPLYARFGGGKGAPKIMFKHILRPAVTALGTCSSVATIPTNMEEAEKTGVPKDVSEIVLPLGATMHMDGSCFSCVLKIAFLFGVFGIPFDGIGTFLEVILVAVVSSVGMSGIPGGGYIGEFIICSIFFPSQMDLAYPIAITIGNLVDPPATMVNSAGDYVVSYIVARFTDGKDWLKDAMSRKALESQEESKP
ncbi:MAG: dicarboxylate/amino acid:cation symporter [Clostridiales bacterium]|nr:dicarboxylate/amino acid:cation symporter [Clostridiales bacterium]